MLQILASLTILLIFSACSSLGHNKTYPYSTEHALVHNNKTAIAITNLADVEPDDNDIVLHNLQLGILHHKNGNFDQSNKFLEIAKTKQKYYEKISLYEQTASVITNDKAKAFVANYYEVYWLYLLKILNFVELNQLDSARVEMLQFDVYLQGIKTDKTKQRVAANFYYLLGTFYEKLGQNDDALISYRFAYNNSTQHNANSLLVADYARLLVVVGINNEFAKLRKTYKQYNKKALLAKQKLNQCVLLHQQGLVDGKMPLRITAQDTHGIPYSIEVPKYNDYNANFNPNISINKVKQKNLLLMDVQEAERNILSADMPTIILKTVARIAAKALVSKALTQNDNAAAAATGLLLFAIILEVTESADLRSWNMLPAQLVISKSYSKSTECNVSVANIAIANKSNTKSNAKQNSKITIINNLTNQ